MTALQLFTVFHTALSITAIIAGVMVVKGLLASADRQLWTLLFLCTAAVTTVTGFLFPFNEITPAIAISIISIVPITIAFVARYRQGQTGAWRGIYVICAVMTLYSNIFVLMAQAFQKVPSLNALAPTLKEPPFQIAQIVTMILFFVVGFFSFKNYWPKNRRENLTAEYVSPRPY